MSGHGENVKHLHQRGPICFSFTENGSIDAVCPNTPLLHKWGPRETIYETVWCLSESTLFLITTVCLNDVCHIVNNQIMKTKNISNFNTTTWKLGKVTRVRVSQSGNMRTRGVRHHYSPPPSPTANTQTRTRRLSLGAWASWFPYTAFRDALSRTWATWGSLGTGKSHSNSGLKICLPPSQHGRNIDSFMLAICKDQGPACQTLVCVSRVRNSTCFQHQQRICSCCWSTIRKHNLSTM